MTLFLCGCSAKTVSVEGDICYDDIPNSTQGWGFRRTDNGPEFSEKQIKQMEEYDCIYKENSDEKSLFLTFDEGYEKGYTSIILDTLREKGVKAAFFVTGDYVSKNPEIIRRMIRDGHIVGNHTINHPSLPDIKNTDDLLKELTELDRMVCNLGGKKCSYLRPPKGEYSERTLKITSEHGYTNVFWSQAYVDWNDDVDKETAFNKVTEGLCGGCVLLLHAVCRGNAEALADIIDYARKEGYTFKSLEEYNKN